ncbi:MAG: hypothetical protein PVH77_06510 [Phycisphaerales bacterium]|jgi:hypothetical protein
MLIDDTITTLTKIYQSIDKGIPKTAASPNALVNHLNDLYIESGDDLSSKELFGYDDVGSPSITLTIAIDVDFDVKTAMENMRARLHAKRRDQADEIGKTGVVWSYGRYDFVCDDDAGFLRISHRYSHRRRDTRSILSVIKQMISYAIDYLEEARKFEEEGTGIPEIE